MRPTAQPRRSTSDAWPAIRLGENLGPCRGACSSPSRSRVKHAPLEPSCRERVLLPTAASFRSSKRGCRTSRTHAPHDEGLGRPRQTQVPGPFRKPRTTAKRLAPRNVAPWNGCPGDRRALNRPSRHPVFVRGVMAARTVALGRSSRQRRPERDEVPAFDSIQRLDALIAMEEVLRAADRIDRATAEIRLLSAVLNKVDKNITAAAKRAVKRIGHWPLRLNSRKANERRDD